MGNPDALSRISEVTTSVAPETSTITSSSYRSSRSLDRPRRTLAASGAMASDSSAACSDSETSNLGNRASVPSLDKKDLQRAVAHLQETLQQRMTMQPHTHG